MKKKSLLMIAVATLGLTAATMAQNVPSYVPTNGLVGWWPFNGNANDESGNGNNGTPSTGVTLTVDRFLMSNAAYDFNGSGNISLSSLPTTGSQDFTISGWIKTNNTSVRKGIACWGQDQPWESTYFFITNTGYLNFGFAYNGGPQSSTFIADNQWHHVAVTCANGLIQLFLDGQPTASQLQMNPNINGANKALGANIDNSGSNNFIGTLDDFAIWNRALSQQELTDLYNGTNVGISDNNFSDKIQVYPNPSNDHITIDTGNLATMNGYSIKIEDAQGQEVFQNAVNQQQFYVDITTWGGNGLYFVRIIDPQGNTVDIKKIVLQ